MLRHPDIDPVAVSLGPLSIHWYGLMYLAGFAAAWYIAKRRSHQPWSPLNEAQVEDLIFYGAVGVILGGRFGYVISPSFCKIHCGCFGFGKVGWPFTADCLASLLLLRSMLAKLKYRYRRCGILSHR